MNVGLPFKIFLFKDISAVIGKRQYVHFGEKRDFVLCTMNVSLLPEHGECVQGHRMSIISISVYRTASVCHKSDEITKCRQIDVLYGC